MSKPTHTAYIKDETGRPVSVNGHYYLEPDEIDSDILHDFSGRLPEDLEKDIIQAAKDFENEPLSFYSAEDDLEETDREAIWALRLGKVPADRFLSELKRLDPILKKAQTLEAPDEKRFEEDLKNESDLDRRIAHALFDDHIGDLFVGKHGQIWVILGPDAESDEYLCAPVNLWDVEQVCYFRLKDFLAAKELIPAASAAAMLKDTPVPYDVPMLEYKANDLQDAIQALMSDWDMLDDTEKQRRYERYLEMDAELADIQKKESEASDAIFAAIDSLFADRPRIQVIDSQDVEKAAARLEIPDWMRETIADFAKTIIDEEQQNE